MAASKVGHPAPCQIYAVLETGAGAADRLSALLAAAPLASLMITPMAGQHLTAATTKHLVDLAQAKHCAAILQDDAALARTLRADGVHLSFSEDQLARYQEARSIVGGGVSVGVDVGASRHLAMELGEAGADYIGFSPVDAPSVAVAPQDDDAVANEDADTGPQSQDELVAWWSEVFEVPCVALHATSVDDVRIWAGLGADFVTLTFSGGESIAASVDRLKAAVKAAEAADAN
jgi:thiamine-phosphate pyrophosphorylase